MALDADRGQAGGRAARTQRRRTALTPIRQGVLCATAYAAALMIGAGPSASAGAVAGWIGLSESAVIVNEEVLDNLSADPSAGLGYMASDTLLHPPKEFPKSRLLVPAPARPTAAVTPPAAGAFQSRILAPLTTEAGPPDLPSVEDTAARAPAPQAPVPDTASPTPPAAIPEVAAAPRVELPPAPTAALPPPPPPLTQELKAAQAPPIPAAEPAPPEASSGEAQVAALPPVLAPLGDTRLLFATGSIELSDEAKDALRMVARQLTQESATRVQLMAYAQGNGDSTSRARRLSLSRALAVRAFLIDEGIRSTRMDIRALGTQAGDGPADRVDILPRAR